MSTLLWPLCGASNPSYILNSLLSMTHSLFQQKPGGRIFTWLCPAASLIYSLGLLVPQFLFAVPKEILL